MWALFFIIDLTLCQPSASHTRYHLLLSSSAGDWAAVGATTALLADHSDTESEAKGSSFSSRDSLDGDVESNRALELDRLVESGDWEGVVLALAQYEGVGLTLDERADQEMRAVSSAEKAMRGLSPGTTSKASKSGESGGGEGSEKDMDEIRAEVESLVRRVLPDEIGEFKHMRLSGA